MSHGGHRHILTVLELVTQKVVYYILLTKIVMLYLLERLTRYITSYFFFNYVIIA